MRHVVTRSIITLGDSLLAKGQLFATQFCYIVSEADWGTLTSPTAKLVLLLSSATGATNIEAFATTEAIQCTEIYKFVQRLGNKDFLQVQNQCLNHCIHTLSLLVTALQIPSPAAAAGGQPEHPAQVYPCVTGGLMVDQHLTPSPMLPKRLTPLMFFKHHMCQNDHLRPPGQGGAD